MPLPQRQFCVPGERKLFCSRTDASNERSVPIFIQPQSARGASGLVALRRCTAWMRARAVTEALVRHHLTLPRGSHTVTLWLDADAAPRAVKEICYRVSERLKLETVLVANARLQLPVGYPYVTAVRVEGGPDVADRYIAEHAVAGDVAVTQDIPLAALLVPTGVRVIDPRGDEYTAEIIGERLSVRNFMEGLRSTGVDTGGHAAYGDKEKQRFANALDRILARKP